MKFCNPKKQQEKLETLKDFETFLGGSFDSLYGYTTIHNSTTDSSDNRISDTLHSLINDYEYVTLDQVYNETISPSNIESSFNQKNNLNIDHSSYIAYMSPTQYERWIYSVDNDINNNLNTKREWKMQVLMVMKLVGYYIRNFLVRFSHLMRKPFL